MTTKDRAVLDQIETYGGSFIKQLFTAYAFADPTNKQKMRTTWHAEWAKFADMAKKHSEANPELEGL